MGRDLFIVLLSTICAFLRDANLLIDLEAGEPDCSSLVVVSVVFNLERKTDLADLGVEFAISGIGDSGALFDNTAVGGLVGGSEVTFAQDSAIDCGEATFADIVVESILLSLEYNNNSNLRM